ncbi:MAG TPA: hypothetical protein VF035_08310 [Longimicrobiales bacterium]
MELKLAVICETARERSDGRIDVIGIFDELHAAAFPAVQERMTIVFVMEWTEDEYGEQPFRADLVHENGRKILGLQGYTTVRQMGSGRPKTRLIQQLDKVVFPAAGEYHFELVAGGDIIETARVRLVENPDTTPAG